MARYRYIDVSEALDALSEAIGKCGENGGKCECRITDTTGHPLVIAAEYYDAQSTWAFSIEQPGLYAGFGPHHFVAEFIMHLVTADKCKLKIGDQLYTYWDLIYVNNCSHPFYGQLIDRKMGDCVYASITLGQFLGLEG